MNDIALQKFRSWINFNLKDAFDYVVSMTKYAIATGNPDVKTYAAETMKPYIPTKELEQIYKYYGVDPRYYTYTPDDILRYINEELKDSK